MQLGDVTPAPFLDIGAGVSIRIFFMLCRPLNCGELLSRLNGLRAHLVGLVLMALAVPVAGGAWYLERQLDERMTQTRDLARQMAEQGVDKQQDILRDARNLLAVLALVPAIRESEEAQIDDCVGILKALPQRHPWTTGAWVTDKTGKILCDTSGPGLRLSLGDRPYFQQVLETRSFMVSGYIVGRQSGKAIIVAAMPILGPDGIRRVVGVSIDLTWMNELLRQDEHADTRIAVLDAEGNILARHPDPEGWIGKDMGNLPLTRTLMRNAPTVLEGVSADGPRRVWSSAKIAETGAVFVVGLPMEPILAERQRDRLKGLALLATAAAAAFALAWAVAQVSVLRWMTALSSAAERIGDGAPADLDADQAPNEIAALARAMNRMSERLIERERAHECALREARQKAPAVSDS